MEWYEAAALLVGIVVALMLLGVPVAFAFLASNLVGALVFMGGFRAFPQIIVNATESVTIFALVPVPLFIIMGELFFHTGLAIRVFDALDKCFGRIPGRLSYITVAGGTIFATLSGSTMANTAMMGALMVPDMTRRGYKRHMSMGPILGTGGLAMIIPPSALAVLLASLAEIDIGALLIAGVIPGLILAALYAMLIYAQVRIDPEAAPAYDVESSTLGEVVRAVVVNILPMSVVVFCVIGLIILGVATPTEAAGFGAFGVMVLGVAYRVLTWDALAKSFMGALRITALVLLIIVGSSTFSQILAFSGATSGLIGWATNVEVAPIVMLLVMFAVLLVFGMFMDQVSMMLITVPIFFPARPDARVRPRVVRAGDAAGPRDQPDHPALRAAAVRDDGGGAGGDEARPCGARRRALYRLRFRRSRPADRLPADCALAARPDAELSGAVFEPSGAVDPLLKLRPVRRRHRIAADEDIDFSDIPEPNESFWREAELVEPDLTGDQRCAGQSLPTTA